MVRRKSMDITSYVLGYTKGKAERNPSENTIEIQPLAVTANGSYTAPAGCAYSPVTVSVATGGTIDFPYELEEILPPTALTFSVGAYSDMPNTPSAIIADKNTVKNMNVIEDGDSGLVIWDGVLYAAYAGSRRSAPILVMGNQTVFSITNAIGNIGIPSNIFGATPAAETQKAGASNEPFFIVANNDWGFVVAIPEDSTVLTHTVQIFKFVTK